SFRRLGRSRPACPSKFQLCGRGPLLFRVCAKLSSGSQSCPVQVPWAAHKSRPFLWIVNFLLRGSASPHPPRARLESGATSACATAAKAADWALRETPREEILLCLAANS